MLDDYVRKVTDRARMRSLKVDTAGFDLKRLQILKSRKYTFMVICMFFFKKVG